MTKSQELLIKLLSLAFGNQPETSAFASADWNEILDQSYKQEVNSVAFDGYQKIHQSLGENALPMDDLMDWLGQTNHQESIFDNQLEVSKKLASLFHTYRLTTYILKGASIAKCYPVPSHRYSCDFDCYLVSRSKNPDPLYEAHEIGNKIIEGKGISVDRSYYKNSSFVFKDLHVENHRFCCSIKRGKRTKELEDYLASLLKEEASDFLDESSLALPPLMFQALFLIEHACGHFLYEKMSLKNICDWAMFRRYYQEQLDWKEFDSLCERFSLKNFADTLGHLADYVLGDCEYTDLTPLDKRVLEDSLKEVNLPKEKMLQRVRKGFDVLCSSWKFKHFSSDGMLKEFNHSFWSYFVNRDFE